ncbi:MAG: MlaD family protein [Bacteroidales bacterium]
MKKIPREAVIGFFMLLIIAILIWGISFLKGKNILTKNKEYFALYQRIDGLEKASPVYLNGFRVGLVENIYFHPDKSGRLVVQLSVQNSINIPKGSKLVLYNHDFLGTKALRLDYSQSSQLETPGDTLHTLFEAGITDQLAEQLMPVKEKAERLIVSMDTMINVINQSDDHIQATLQNLSSGSEEFKYLMKNQRHRLGKIIRNAESISDNLAQNNEQVSTILENFSAVSDTLAKANVGQTIRNATLALSEFQLILTKVEKGEGSLGQLVNNDSLYNNMENAARDLDSLLIDMKEHPGRYIHFSVFGKKNK